MVDVEAPQPQTVCSFLFASDESLGHGLEQIIKRNMYAMHDETSFSRIKTRLSAAHTRVAVVTYRRRDANRGLPPLPR